MENWGTSRVLIGRMTGFFLEKGLEKSNPKVGQSRIWSLGNWGRLHGGGDLEPRTEISVKIYKVNKRMYVYCLGQ